MVGQIGLNGAVFPARDLAQCVRHAVDAGVHTVIVAEEEAGRAATAGRRHRPRRQRPAPRGGRPHRGPGEGVTGGRGREQAAPPGPGPSLASAQKRPKERHGSHPRSDPGHGPRRALDRALRFLTLGAQSRNSHALSHGDRLAAVHAGQLVDHGRSRAMVVVRHERSISDSGSARLCLMTFLYLSPFFRWPRLRARAPRVGGLPETLRATAEVRASRARARGLRERIVARFTGPDYGWMWPFRSQGRTLDDRALDRARRDGPGVCS